ncbi:MAG: DUF4837 family protein [candidate division WOR-3 bacterium]
MKKISILFIFFLTCTSPYFPKGKPEELVIFSEGLLKMKDFIETEIQDTFYTPRPEPIYDIIFAKVSEFEKYKGYYTILILATPSSASYEIFKDIFPEAQKRGVYEKRKIFQKEDYIVGILGPDEDYILSELKEVLNRLTLRIKELYKKHVYNIIDVNNSIKREIKKEYGFEIDIPTGFLYIKKSKDFISLGAHYPDRFIFFYISEKVLELDPEKLMDLRDSLTEIYYDGDKIDRELTKWKRIKIFDEEGMEIYGHWENEKMKIGGAFKSLIFKKKDRYYFIDMGVFEPEKPKLKYIRWLEAIVSTMKWSY